jgi:diguanylate cyclase (GGDEF)-like protein
VRSRRPSPEPSIDLAPQGARPHALPGPGAVDDPTGKSFLVIIDHPRYGRVGEHHVLTRDITRLGRDSEDVDWALEDFSVSRQQCQVERLGDRWFLRDLGSINGTWVGKDRLERNAHRELRSGDRIRLGNLIIRFFGDEGASSKDRGTLLGKSPVDALTGLSSRTFILDALDAAIVAAKQDRGAISALVIRVDQMDRLDDDESEPVGDHVLKAFARVLESIRPPRDLVGRLEGNAFLLVRPYSESGADDIVCRTVRTHDWHLGEEMFRVTASVGVASVARGAGRRYADATWFVGAARRASREAHEKGGNTSVLADTSRLVRRSTMNGEGLRPDRLDGPLAAFRVGDEEAVIQLGEAMLDRWQTQLFKLIDGSTPMNGTLWRYKGHVFMAPGADAAHEIDQILHGVQSKWASYPVPLLHQRTLARSLTCGALTTEEVREHGERALDVLLERMPPRSVAALPSPLEALRRGAETHALEHVRAKTLCSAIRTALQRIGNRWLWRR